MRCSLLNKVGLALVSILGIAMLSACTSTTTPYRVYYLDRTCHYYYVDGMGNKVYDGKYGDQEFVGLKLRRDMNGRWYYQDSFGNKIYKSKRCSW